MDKKGIERFNALFKSVKKDRAKRPHFIEKLVKQELQETEVGDDSKQDRSITIKAVNSLWDDDDPSMDGRKERNRTTAEDDHSTSSSSENDNNV